MGRGMGCGGVTEASDPDDRGGGRERSGHCISDP